MTRTTSKYQIQNLTYGLEFFPHSKQVNRDQSKLQLEAFKDFEKFNIKKQIYQL